MKRELGESGENAAIFQSVLRVLQSARSAASTNEGRGVDIVKRVTGWSSQRVKIPMSVLTLKRSRPAAGSPITGASSASALRGVGESGETLPDGRSRKLGPVAWFGQEDGGICGVAVELDPLAGVSR